MTDMDKDSRKAIIEARREELSDQIKANSIEFHQLANEYDEILDDEEKNEGLTKLYDVPRGTWISLTKDASTLLFFDHLDGAYSYCLTPEGRLTHIGCGSEVYTYPALDLECPPRPDPTPGEFRTT
jgi:hypothetical protein